MGASSTRFLIFVFMWKSNVNTSGGNLRYWDIISNMVAMKASALHPSSSMVVIGAGLEDLSPCVLPTKPDYPQVMNLFSNYMDPMRISSFHMFLHPCPSFNTFICSQVSSRKSQQHGSMHSATSRDNSHTYFIGLCFPFVFRSQGSHVVNSSVDILKYGLHAESSASGRKILKFSWKKILCWRQSRKYGLALCGSCTLSELSTFSNPVVRPKFPAPTAAYQCHERRVISGPIYSDGLSILPSQRSNISHSVIIVTPKLLLHRNDDSNVSTYIPLSCKLRIPSGPLYFP